MNKVTDEYLTSMIPLVHSASRAKGFWTPVPESCELLMEIGSELGECLDAVLHNRRCKVSKPILANIATYMEDPDDQARELFKTHVKDTLEDEISDCFIRVMDFIGGYWLTQEVVLRRKTISPGDMVTGDTTTRHQLYVLSRRVYNVLHPKTGEMQPTQLAWLLVGIERFCQSHGIDLITHIRAKMAYNLTRPYRHGKP